MKYLYLFDTLILEDTESIGLLLFYSFEKEVVKIAINESFYNLLMYQRE